MKFFVTNKQIERMKANTVTAEPASTTDNEVYTNAINSCRDECAMVVNLRDPNITVFSIERVTMGKTTEKTTVSPIVPSIAPRKAPREATPRR